MEPFRKNKKQIILLPVHYPSIIQIVKYLLIFFISFSDLHSQSDLRKDSLFFNQQLKEFGAWLEKTNISSIAHIDRLEINSDNLALFLESNYSTDDSLKVAWKTLQEEYDSTNIERVSEKIFNIFVFLFDIGSDSVTIYIKGKEFKDSEVKIYYKEYIRVDENFSNAMASGNFEINLKDIKIEHSKILSSVSVEASIPKIRKSISEFLKNYYSHKADGWLYTVNVDTTRTFFNKFTYIITCIKDEIISDGYYEFIQIQIQVTYTKENQIQISYDIQGKYASGILCPKQREKFYKSMETNYSEKVKKYAQDTIDRINAHLRDGF